MPVKSEGSGNGLLGSLATVPATKLLPHSSSNAASLHTLLLVSYALDVETCSIILVQIPPATSNFRNSKCHGSNSCQDGEILCQVHDESILRGRKRYDGKMLMDEVVRRTALDAQRLFITCID